MDIEFHYYITNIIARRAGFSKKNAGIIAYASQYVDDNDICFEIEDKTGNSKPYGNYISQTMDILKPKNELLQIYPIFHFLPGEPDDKRASRKDGKMHLLNTTPNGELSNILMDHAFTAASNIRMYQIGVATHAYVDTWAHQNFVGRNDGFNGMAFDIKPNIGHADAEHNPDYPAHYWKDSRLSSEYSHINNIDRFLDAGKCLFNKYKDYIKNNPGDGDSAQTSNWGSLKTKIEKAIGTVTWGGDGMAGRIESYKGVEPIDEFDESKWFNHAITTDVRGFPDSEDGIMKEHFTFFRDKYYWKKEKYKTTDWYKFQQAVKAHEDTALKEKRFYEPFKRMDIEFKKK